jgi:hypothetical protein
VDNGDRLGIVLAIYERRCVMKELKTLELCALSLVVHQNPGYKFCVKGVSRNKDKKGGRVVHTLAIRAQGLPVKKVQAWREFGKWKLSLGENVYDEPETL